MLTVTANSPAECEAAIANLKPGDVLRFSPSDERKVTKVTLKPCGRVVVWITGNGILFTNSVLTGFFYEPSYKARVKCLKAFGVTPAA